MILEFLFRREVYIRLAEGRDVLVCTIKSGPFLSRTTEFGLGEASADIALRSAWNGAGMPSERDEE
jgi:hypothetical protein